MSLPQSKARAPPFPSSSYRAGTAGAPIRRSACSAWYSCMDVRFSMTTSAISTRAGTARVLLRRPSFTAAERRAASSDDRRSRRASSSSISLAPARIRSTAATMEEQSTSRRRDVVDSDGCMPFPGVMTESMLISTRGETSFDDLARVFARVAPIRRSRRTWRSPAHPAWGRVRRRHGAPQAAGRRGRGGSGVRRHP